MAEHREDSLLHHHPTDSRGMRAPTASAPFALPRPNKGVPARFRGVLAAVLAFGASLTVLTLLDAPDHDLAVERHDLKIDWHPDLSRRLENQEAELAAKAKEGELGDTTITVAENCVDAVLTHKGFGGYVDALWSVFRCIHENRAKAKEAKLAAKAKEAKLAVDVNSLEWSETTSAFLPVLSQSDFKRKINTFRSTLYCFHKNGLHLIPTGGTLVGTLRHEGMIPWDDDIDVYYFVQDTKAIFDEEGPVQTCLKKQGITPKYYGPHENCPAKRDRRTECPRMNIRFRMLSAFPAYHVGDNIDFVSQSIEPWRSSMPQVDVFPLKKYPFHDYHVYLPHNIEKYLAADWSKNQADEVKTSTLAELMSTAVAGHVHKGCPRETAVANITDVEFLQYYDPKKPLSTLPFRSKGCSGRVLREYEEYVYEEYVWTR